MSEPSDVSADFPPAVQALAYYSSPPWKSTPARTAPYVHLTDAQRTMLNTALAVQLADDAGVPAVPTPTVDAFRSAAAALPDLAAAAAGSPEAYDSLLTAAATVRAAQDAWMQAQTPTPTPGSRTEVQTAEFLVRRGLHRSPSGGPSGASAEVAAWNAALLDQLARLAFACAEPGMADSARKAWESPFAQPTASVDDLGTDNSNAYLVTVEALRHQGVAARGLAGAATSPPSTARKPDLPVRLPKLTRHSGQGHGRN